MVSQNLATDLALGVLAPAASVRAADRQAANPDAPAKVRRRSRPEDEHEGSDERDQNAASDIGGQPVHQLDHLA